MQNTVFNPFSILVLHAYCRMHMHTKQGYLNINFWPSYLPTTSSCNFVKKNFLEFLNMNFMIFSWHVALYCTNTSAHSNDYSTLTTFTTCKCSNLLTITSTTHVQGAKKEADHVVFAI